MKAANVPERVHLVGIGGAHMSAIAQILHAWGHSVSGSDQRASAMTEKLAALGVTVVSERTQVSSSGPSAAPEAQRGIIHRRKDPSLRSG